MPGGAEGYNIVCVVQDGRLSYEAIVLAASLRATNPGFAGRLLMAEPQPGPLWPGDVRVRPHVRAVLESLGAEILPFDSKSARHAGNIRVTLEKQGRAIGAYDLLIAATARAHGLVLATGNLREFTRVEALRTEKWP